jgi:hypothetical protein
MTKAPESHAPGTKASACADEQFLLSAPLRAKLDGLFLYQLSRCPTGLIGRLTARAIHYKVRPRLSQLRAQEKVCGFEIQPRP